ncbi:hypothetical protein SAMN05421823_103528 [Catalinimonas alkaloidigena]|uniref:Uncharacterized protein n=1 Tax=Catalinimonas alkaloidigena TaxID=1075417 RepID=A0A1G9EMZ3_9BACT|nr:hypothetical protein [Catalinimonas alkaloidigena]SDK77458.1 hypothetical protein SAMN05421823_103528 [Catalinimonas alkaloidigena]
MAKLRFRKIKSENLIAWMATLVSICALGTTAYQTYILKQQQHAAVWPRLELLHGWRVNGEDSYYRLNLRNTGVGPAIIRRVTILYAGDTLRDFAHLAQAVAAKHHLPDSLAYQDYQDLLADMVIPQQEEKRLLYLDKEAYVANLGHSTRSNAGDLIQVSVVYESLYGDAWEVTYPQTSHREVD